MKRYFEYWSDALKDDFTKDLAAWRGKDFTADELRGFELKNVLGAWAMITVAKSVGNNGIGGGKNVFNRAV